MKDKMTPKEIVAMLLKIYSTDLDTLRAVKQEVKDQWIAIEDESTFEAVRLHCIYDDLFDAINELEYHQ